MTETKEKKLGFFASRKRENQIREGLRPLLDFLNKRKAKPKEMPTPPEPVLEEGNVLDLEEARNKLACLGLSDWEQIEIDVSLGIQGTLTAMGNIGRLFEYIGLQSAVLTQYFEPYQRILEGHSDEVTFQWWPMTQRVVGTILEGGLPKLEKSNFDPWDYIHIPNEVADELITAIERRNEDLDEVRDEFEEQRYKRRYATLKGWLDSYNVDQGKNLIDHITVLGDEYPSETIKDLEIVVEIEKTKDRKSVREYAEVKLAEIRAKLEDEA